MNDFEDIYHTYFKDVYRYIKSITKSEELAEEITADTFFKAMKSLNKFNGSCSIRVWLCQIAKNSYITYLRKNKRLVNINSVVEPADESDILQQLCSSEEASRILEALHELSEPYKEVFMLRVYGELSFRQIARLFDKNENWACVTYHRAKDKIKSKLEETK